MIKTQTLGSIKAGAKKAIKTKNGVKITDGSSESSNNTTTQGEEGPKAIKNVRQQLKRATLKWCLKQELQSSLEETWSDIPGIENEVLIKL